ncbi:iron-containing alcohol dehydrogenase [Bacillaceae bacterium SIJ1]|uniref:iron-containing alcohol dehydrogenase n=1 Tax=Litoribacterium kuwaitense TaxID=1398745 RepID=UPI0013EBC271|nr:iron-containing alcohol dehydrogenase [Litoribacterium kuwaitense]NGP44289.1 iron-containing alcohol dehydrogenase [Litoribacterium kuwaitense]
MQTFVYHNPTRLIFGEGVTEQLIEQLEPYGSKILLVYGGGSIKRSGLYDHVVKLLQEANKTVFELAGVEPNPRVETARKGVQICKENDVDVILAVGGGSVIDCTKLIAAASLHDADAWDIVQKKVTVERAMPFGTILTLAATGSEMNSGSVITNWETKEKDSWGSPHVFPAFSLLDPRHTVTVPKDHTVYGMVDIMSHCFEQYFHHDENTHVQDRFNEGLLKTVIATAPELLKDLSNITHRETILYAGTMALNGTLSMGVRGDWACHNLEHAISAVHDIPHAGGLAIIFPHWMQHVLQENVERFKQFAIRVFEVHPLGKTDEEIALEGIEKLRVFWTSLGAPERLADYGIEENTLPTIVEQAMENGPFGQFSTLNASDCEAILRASL